MINGAHVVIYSKDAEADRAFFKDVLELRSVDAGGGWLIFALPPAEAACHPAEENNQHELFLMCEDLQATISALAAKGVQCGDLQELPWGTLTKIQLPGGGGLGLYQPGHQRP
jgi:catechol 2,3-dioxygenase-like lactoylglutathione lyase family enzyme